MEALDRDALREAMVKVLAEGLDEPPSLELTEFTDLMRKEQPDALLVLTARRPRGDQVLYDAARLIHACLPELAPPGWWLAMSLWDDRSFNEFDDEFGNVCVQEFWLSAQLV
jgi:hypothetical protein